MWAGWLWQRLQRRRGEDVAQAVAWAGRGGELSEGIVDGAAAALEFKPGAHQLRHGGVEHERRRWHGRRRLLLAQPGVIRGSLGK
jgi:hypothetical protein